VTKLYIPESIYNGVLAILRQYLLSMIPSWSIIGMSVDSGINYQSVNGVIQNTSDIMTTLQSFTYLPRESIDSDFVVESFAVNSNSPFTMLDLDNNLEYFWIPEILSDSNKKDSVLMSVVDGYIRISLIFRLATGGHTLSENQEILMQNGYSIGSTCISFHSNHCNFKKINCKEGKAVNGLKLLQIDLGSEDEDDIIVEALQNISGIFSSLAENAE